MARTTEELPSEQISEQINELANFLMKEFPEEIGKDGISEGAIEVAIRVLAELSAKLREREWQDISTAPKNLRIVTFGCFRPANSSREIFIIREVHDIIRDNQEEGIKFVYDDMFGSYERLHWQPIPSCSKVK